MTEHRLFQRISFVAKAEVEISGARHEATLVDISLKGALVNFVTPFLPERGQQCSLTIHLNQSELELHCTGVTVHSHDQLTGIKFTMIDIDTMIHLRRLVELNSADPERVLSELSYFIGGE
jgi:hypothetical protein